jgi:hypothetical protein
MTEDGWQSQECRLEHLGGDVWASDREAPEQLKISGRMHFRFMDRLFIPAPTSELCLNSIVAINRWREQILAQSELPHRSLVRRVALAACEEIGPDGLVEIGCGKYPAAGELDMRWYKGVDVDPEAVRDGSRSGLSITASISDLAPAAASTTCILSLFALQFPVGDDFIAFLRRTHPDCVLIANLATKDPLLVQSRLAQLASAGFDTVSIDFADAHDRLFVAARTGSVVRRNRAAAAAKKAA